MAAYPSRPEPESRRAVERPGSDRRRPTWREFRLAYPGILATMGIALALVLAMDGWLLYKRARYQREIARLRAGMTAVERRRADMEIASGERRLQVMVELARRQALGDKDLHLSVAVDSGRMHLERDGAKLRDMTVSVGPEKWVGSAPDTVLMATPRGTRSVEKILDASSGWEVPRWVYTDRGLEPPADRTLTGALGPVAVLLSGGAVMYTMPSVGPLNDSAYVMPGSVRVRTEDLQAIVENLKPGMRVYFY